MGTVAEHAARAGIKSIAIPAYWILKEGTKWSPEHEKTRKDEEVMLYLHRGGLMVRFFSPSCRVFVLLLASDGTAYPSHPTASFAKGTLICSTSLSRVLSVDYRLSSGSPFERWNPFPAAVINAIAAYKYLVCGR